MKKILSSFIFCSLFSYIQGDKLPITNTRYDNNYHLRLIKSQSQKSSNPNEGMLPGMGYSTDKRSRGMTTCYKPLTVTKSDQLSIVNFNTAHDITKLIELFNVRSSFRAGYGLFSANAMFKYFKSLEEDYYSLSMNYYQKVTQSVNMTYSYDPDTLLTDTGKAIYRNGENPLFRLFCGDRLVNSYEEGAGLIMSMKVTLASRSQKEIFRRNIGVSYGGFFGASQRAQKIAEQHNLNGRIKLEGFQLGGDPTQLSRILSGRTIECNIRNVTACEDTAKVMLDYASKNFPEQFRTESGIWVSPLTTTGGITPGDFVEDIGIKIHPTYLTPEVIEAQNFLRTAQIKNQGALARANSLLIDFPYGEVANPIPNEQKTKIVSLSENVKSNLNLLHTGSENGSAIDCFKAPNRCIIIKNEIASKLRSVEDPTIALASCRTPNFHELALYCTIQGRRPIGHIDYRTTQIVPPSSISGDCRASAETDLGIGWDKCDEPPLLYKPTKWCTSEGIENCKVP